MIFNICFAVAATLTLVGTLVNRLHDFPFPKIENFKIKRKKERNPAASRPEPRGAAKPNPSDEAAFSFSGIWQ